MSEYVMFTEELLRNFYDPTTCSYMIPLSGKAAHDMGVLRQENAELKTENTKLQELVRDVIRDMRGCHHDIDCGWCDFEECPYEVRAHELKIEVYN